MIVRTGTGLVAIVLLLLVLGLGILNSTAGNRYIVRLVEDSLAPALTVSSVEGSLLNTLCADRVEYAQPGLKVIVREVCVSVKLWASVDFLNLSLEYIEAAEVNVQTSDEGAAENPEPFRLPLVISVDDLQVAELVVNELQATAVQGAVTLSNSDLAVQAELIYQKEAVRILSQGPWARFQVELTAMNALVQAEMNLDADGLPWSLEATTPGISLAPFADRDISLSDVRLSGAGNLKDYEFQIEAGVRDPLVAGHVDGAGTGDWQGISLERLTLRDVVPADFPVRVDVLTATGRLNWMDSFSADFLGVSANGTVSGRPLAVTLDGLSLDTSGVAVAAGVVQLVEAADARLELDGELGYAGALEFALKATSLPLELADERLSGEAQASALVSGSIEAPRIKGDFALARFTWEGRPVGDLAGRITGSPTAGTLSASLSAGQGTAEAETSYTMADGALTLGIQSFNLSLPDLESTVKLEAPTTLTYAGGGLSLGATCFRLGTRLLEVDAGRACAALDYPDGGLSLRIDPWRVPPLQFPDSQIALSGVAALNVAIDTFSPLSGNAELLLSELMAHHSDMVPVELGEVTAKAGVQDDVAVLELTTPDGKKQNLRLDGTLSSELAAELAASTLSGDLTATLDGIWVAETLLPMDVTFELEGIEGILNVKTVFGGTLREPLVNGSLTLTDAGWRVLAVNSTFSGFDLEAALHESDRISFDSQGAVGKGRLKVTGNVAGLGAGEPRLTTRFELDDAGVLDLPEYQAILDGEVTLDMGRSDLSLKGALEMPRARIVVAELPETAVSGSADEIIVDADATTTTQQIRTTDLQLTLGRDVRLEAFGLTTRLSGNLRVVEAPGRIRSVTGVINLREGEFEAYGQTLALERGQLTFTGPVDNPTVDVTATRTVTYDDKDYRISLLISGSAKNLQTSVTSQPSLPEDDALALLITGQTFSQISSSEQTNVYGAALSLGLFGASRVTQNLASALQLEEIILDQDADGNMEVGAAIRLRRDFYLRYTYGVFSRIGGLLLRYRLNKRVSVQAVTGDAHSIEIRYGVDE